MCGLVGVIGEPVDDQKVKNVLADMRHRGPNYSGVEHSNEWWLGHNRLAILDLDARSNQPFHSADDRYILTFNGEIYNYKLIRKELEGKGYRFRTESDTEVILYAYQHWKSDCFVQLQGQFAFSIVDKVEQKVILVRDRFGEKPLFYSVHNGLFIFGSELKCVTALVNIKKLNYEAILDYLHFGFIPAPKTIYEGIFKLEPANFIEYSIAQKRVVAKKSFYHVAFHENNRISKQERKEMFDSIGTTVASQISLADVPLAAFLSGGVDSSAAVYFLNRINKNIHTFTAGFRSDKFDESGFAEKVAAHLGVKNTKRIIDIGDFTHLYDKMIDHYGEPHNDYSFIPTYVICQEAVKDYTVMISGDGADEIFCGYPRFHKLRQFSLVRQIPGAATALGAVARLLPQHFDIRRQLHFAGMSSVDFFYHTMSFNFTSEECVPILGAELVRSSRHYSTRSVIEERLSEIPCDSNIIQKQRYLDIKITLGDDMLVKADRASMANSLEVRPFFLHPLISDFAFGLPVAELATYRTDKAFLKRFLHDKLPHENLYRPKMGFTFPLRELIQGPLKNLFKECIDCLPGELIDLRHMKKLLYLHGLGNRNYTGQLHSLMALGRWISNNVA